MAVVFVVAVVECGTGVAAVDRALAGGFVKSVKLFGLEKWKRLVSLRLASALSVLWISVR